MKKPKVGTKSVEKEKIRLPLSSLFSRDEDSKKKVKPKGKK